MGVYDLERDLVCSFEKFIAVCPGCGKEMLKKSMVTILSKDRYSNPKTLTHLCADCYTSICDRYGIATK